jgi:membrane associated rhomboid family serine protease
MADPTPGEVPKALPAPEQAPGAPAPQVVRVSEPPPPAPRRKASKWNPLKTPVSWLFLVLQVGLFLVGGYLSSQANVASPYENPSMSRLGLLDTGRITEEPWRLLACLFLETLALQLLLNSWLFFSMGPELERVYKSVRFAILYLVGGLCCILTTDILAQSPALHMSTSVGAGARHAIFCVYGAVIGLIAATEGFKAMLTSRFVWSRVGWIGAVVVLAYLLSGPGARFGVGIDVGRWVTDLVIGAIFGYALALTLLGGAKKVLGIVFTLFLCVVTVGEVGFFSLKSVFAPPDRTGFPSGQNVPPNDTGRLPDTVATPRPTLPDDDDPAPIAKIRKQVTEEFLDAYGPLPKYSTDTSDQKGARHWLDKIHDVESHFEGAASANLEAEQAELYLIAGSLQKAGAAAEQGNLIMMEKGLTPEQAKGTKRANRIARCFGVQAIVALSQPDPDEVGAQALIARAFEWDPTIPEVHFFLGKLSNDPKRQKDELQRFLDLAGEVPKEYQQERVEKAKQLLGR